MSLLLECYLGVFYEDIQNMPSFLLEERRISGHRYSELNLCVNLECAGDFS